MTEKEIQSRINEITTQLKATSNTDTAYADLWNERADLKWQLYELKHK